jgi:hypothetical protein
MGCAARHRAIDRFFSLEAADLDIRFHVRGLARNAPGVEPFSGLVA